jgi:hypothetical protein
MIFYSYSSSVLALENWTTYTIDDPEGGCGPGYILSLFQRGEHKEYGI